MDLYLHMEVHILQAVGYNCYICTSVDVCTRLFDC